MDEYKFVMRPNWSSVHSGYMTCRCDDDKTELMDLWIRAVDFFPSYILESCSLLSGRAIVQKNLENQLPWSSELIDAPYSSR